MIRIVAACLFSLFLLQSSAQNLYMPRNVTQAYLHETRSITGRPGSQYWQNYGRYNISITTQPPSRTINGNEQIAYYNRSSDTLQYIVIRIIANIHRPGAVRFTPADPDYLTTGVHIDSFVIDGDVQQWEEDYYHNTVYPIKLPAALRPGDSVHLNIAWHYDLSVKSGREGMLDSTTYYLAYFYPRVSVYDDYNGWDDADFTDAQEFYNDFNDYTLSVSVPKNYIVWSTGTLQNAEAVLQSAYNKRLQASMTADQVMHIATLQELIGKKVTTQNKMNTWRWKADAISDVTVAISDHYVWDAASVEVDTTTHRRASMQAAYNDTAQDFHHMVEYGQRAISWFSRNWPGVPYPFPKMTAVQGYADMEYPMMINDSHTPDTNFSRFVAEHEIAHTYFPFYMGINENRYPFMDEGWATTFEYLIGIADVGKDRAEDLYKNFRIVNWIYTPAEEEDLPIITPQHILRGGGNNAYGKASLGYLAIKDMLGDDLFRKCLHEYMDRWHGKHPIPWDFFFTFNDVSGKNLNWFWNSWYFSNGYIDIAVQNAVHNQSDNTIYVQNIGGFTIPFDVRIRYTDGTTDSLHQTAAVWSANQKATAIVVRGNKIIQSIRLDNGIFMDANERDNYWNAK